MAIEIVITDFVDDPVDDSAFGINFQINGPETRVDYLRVSFTDAFIEEYFDITWPQDLAKKEEQLIHKKRALFILWAVFRVEMWIEEGRPDGNLMIDAGDAVKWARKVEAGQFGPASARQDTHTFLYEN